MSDTEPVGVVPSPMRSGIDDLGGFTVPKEWLTEQGDLLAAVAYVGSSSIVVYRLGAFDAAFHRIREGGRIERRAEQLRPLAASAVEVVRGGRVYFPKEVVASEGIELPAAVSVLYDADKFVLVPPAQEATTRSYFFSAPTNDAQRLWAASSPPAQVARAAELLLLTTTAISPSTLEDLRNLHPRAFEEWVALRLEEEGYVVSMSPVGADGGIDLFAARHDRLGSFVYGVQCKRYGANNPVRVQPIRELVGVLELHRLTAGLLVTTSRFTGPARREASSEHFATRISLRDCTDLESWLRDNTSGLLVPTT